MTRKHNIKSKRPFLPEQEFPRKCNQCAQKRVVMTSVSYDAEVRHDGRNYNFNVPKLEIMICEACGEKVFTGAVDSQINIAFRKHAGLLSPADISATIKRIGMNQKEVAECLGLAEATLSRWLNETQIQSRSMDSLLRTFFAFPQARQILSAESRDCNFGFVEYPAQCIHQGSYVSYGQINKSNSEEWGQIFDAEELNRYREAQVEFSNRGSMWAPLETV